MKFSMSEAWQDATAMMSANREVMLIVAGIFFFLPSVVLAFAIGDLQDIMIADPENAEAAMMTLYGTWWWLIIVVTLASIVGYIALLALLRDTARPTVGEAIKAGVVGLLPAIGMSLLLGIAFVLMILLAVVIIGAAGRSALGFLLGAIGAVVAVYVSVKMSLAYPVIAIDKELNPIKVMARSWQLTKGNSVRLFLFYVLLVIVYIVAAIVISALAGLLSLFAGPSVELAADAIVSGLLSAGVTVVFVAVLAAAHRQLSGPSAAAVSETFE